MKQIILLALLALTGTLVGAPAHAATCSASNAYCNACKNCSGCGHCARGGGTCAVCFRGDARRNAARDTSGSGSVRKVKLKSVKKARLQGLQSGNTGAAVRRWQEFLKYKGFFKGEVGGNFGPKTVRATADFQAANGLTVTA